MESARHFRTCSICEAMCGVAIELDGGAIRSIRGDREDPFSRGHICPKALALQDVHEDPDRLRRPLRRTASGWQEVSWDEALREAGERLAEIQLRHGHSAVALYQGNPNVHNYGALLYGQIFARSLRSRSLFSATSVDQLPHMLASLLMFGHQLLLPVPDLDHTQYFLMLGANPAASNGSLMTAPGVMARLAALRARGGTLVVVDPRRSETAKLATRHVPIRPGSDALFLLALLHTLYEEGLVRPGRLSEFADGLETVARLARPFAPEVVASATGIAAETIRTLARELAAAPSAVCYGRVGVSTQEFGALACWLINVVNVVTGNLDRRGGFLFARPAVDAVALATRFGQSGHFARRRSRVRGLPEFGGEWPVAALAEEIETPGEGQIRGLLTLAGNPVLSTPNGARLDRALTQLDFMVAIDLYRNETTRHAQLILPPTSPLERDHYDLVFHLLAVRNTARYSPALFPRDRGARHDWEILLGLSRELERARGGGVRSALKFALLRRLGPRRLLASALRRGPYRLTLRRLEKAPHGIDLGALEPCLPERLVTASRRIELAPAELVADLARLENRLSTLRAPGLRLIGRRELRSNNSWLHNSARLVKGPDRCTLLMHPDDARDRDLSQGSRVAVRSRAGQVEAMLEITPDMMPGVVSLPHGWGHGRPGVGLTVAGARPGVSLNDVTDEREVDELAGTAILNGVPVEVLPAP